MSISRRRQRNNLYSLHFKKLSVSWSQVTIIALWHMAILGEDKPYLNSCYPGIPEHPKIWPPINFYSAQALLAAFVYSSPVSKESRPTGLKLASRFLRTACLPHNLPGSETVPTAPPSLWGSAQTFWTRHTACISTQLHSGWGLRSPNVVWIKIVKYILKFLLVLARFGQKCCLLKCKSTSLCVTSSPTHIIQLPPEKHRYYYLNLC